MLSIQYIDTLETKVKTAIARLQEFVPRGAGYYLAFSGGKDSVVIHRLAVLAGVEFDAHYNITTVDPPELVKFIKRQYPAVARDKPALSMWQLIPRKLIPPTRTARYCCAELKERGGTGRVVVTGIRAAESYSRSNRRIVERCLRDGSKTFVHPVLDWSDRDVWDFIHAEQLPSCELYREGFARLGCVMCPFQSAAGMLRDAARWPHIYDRYLKAFDAMLQMRHERGLTTSWQSAQAVMEWWIYNPPKIDDRQIMMWE